MGKNLKKTESARIILFILTEILMMMIILLSGLFKVNQVIVSALTCFSKYTVSVVHTKLIRK